VRRGNIPAHYQWQIQHQLAVTGLNDCVLIVSDGKQHIDVGIARDDTMIGDLLEAEQQFYNKMLNWEFPDDNYVKPMERTDKEANEIVDAALKAKEWLDTAKEQYEIIREGAIYLANEISFRCKGVIVRKFLFPGTIDYKKMAKEHNIDPEKYRSPGSVRWRLEFPGEKA